MFTRPSGTGNYFTSSSMVAQTSPRSPSDGGVGDQCSRCGGNGNDNKPLGNPQSRGLPTWFVVPEQHVPQVLETRQFDFSGDKIGFARKFLELRCVYFLTHCPTPTCPKFGELVLKSYRSNELRDRMSELDKDELLFYCIFCHQQWLPTPDEKRRLQLEMETGLRLYEEKVRSAYRSEATASVG